MLSSTSFSALFKTKLLEIFWTIWWRGKKNDGGRSCVLFGRGSIWAAARVHVIGEERDDFVSNSMLFQVFPLLLMTSVTCIKRMNKSMKIRESYVLSAMRKEHAMATLRFLLICIFSWVRHDFHIHGSRVWMMDDGWHSSRSRATATQPVDDLFVRVYQHHYYWQIKGEINCLLWLIRWSPIALSSTFKEPYRAMSK